MKTFIQRLCLFGLLATTGFVLSNCQKQAEEQDATTLERTGPTMRADDGMMGGAYDAGMAPAADAGTVAPMDAGMIGPMDAGMIEATGDAGTMDAGMR